MTDQPEQSQDDADTEAGDLRQPQETGHGEGRGQDASSDGEGVRFDDFALI